MQRWQFWRVCHKNWETKHRARERERERERWIMHDDQSTAWVGNKMANEIGCIRRFAKWFFLSLIILHLVYLPRGSANPLGCMSRTTLLCRHFRLCFMWYIYRNSLAFLETTVNIYSHRSIYRRSLCASLIIRRRRKGGERKGKKGMFEGDMEYARRANLLSGPSSYKEEVSLLPSFVEGNGQRETYTSTYVIYIYIYTVQPSPSYGVKGKKEGSQL